MRGEWFHHPDFCATVMRRRLTADLLDLAEDILKAWATGMRSILWSRAEPGETAYRLAQYRLEKAGFLAYRRVGGRPAVLAVTDAGLARQSPAVRPERRWNRRWHGRWNVLVYDVPESRRFYRDVLRRFLRRQRLGRLQDSVWITPDDIRPEFDDLSKAAAVEDYAVLFEARTVLGIEGPTLAWKAWDFVRIGQAQAWYVQQAADVLARIEAEPPPLHALWRLLREDLDAYLAVMEHDPLLPRALWPPRYRGPATVDAHRALARSVIRRLLLRSAGIPGVHH